MIQFFFSFSSHYLEANSWLNVTKCQNLIIFLPSILKTDGVIFFSLVLKVIMKALIFEAKKDTIKITKHKESECICYTNTYTYITKYDTNNYIYFFGLDLRVNKTILLKFFPWVTIALFTIYAITDSEKAKTRSLSHGSTFYFSYIKFKRMTRNSLGH